MITFIIGRLRVTTLEEEAQRMLSWPDQHTLKRMRATELQRQVDAFKETERAEKLAKKNKPPEAKVDLQMPIAERERLDAANSRLLDALKANIAAGKKLTETQKDIFFNLTGRQAP